MGYREKRARTALSLRWKKERRRQFLSAVRQGFPWLGRADCNRESSVSSRESRKAKGEEGRKQGWKDGRKKDPYQDSLNATNWELPK